MQAWNGLHLGPLSCPLLVMDRCLDGSFSGLGIAGLHCGVLTVGHQSLLWDNEIHSPADPRSSRPSPSRPPSGPPSRPPDLPLSPALSCLDRPRAGICSTAPFQRGLFPEPPGHGFPPGWTPFSLCGGPRGPVAGRTAADLGGGRELVCPAQRRLGLARKRRPVLHRVLLPLPILSGPWRRPCSGSGQSRGCTPRPHCCWDPAERLFLTSLLPTHFFPVRGLISCHHVTLLSVT